MALTNAQRQQAYQSRLKAGITIVKVVRPLPPPVTRKARLAGIVADLTALRDEYQRWMDRLRYELKPYPEFKPVAATPGMRNTL